MSTFSTVRQAIQNPQQFASNIGNLASNAMSPEWMRRNPLSAGILYSSLPINLASGAVSLAASTTDNPQLDNYATVANWVIDPIVDTAAEFVTNKHLHGMSNRRAGVAAGGSLAGTMAGQVVASQLFKNADGTENPAATFVGGYIGDAIGDSMALKALELSKNLLKGRRRI